MAEAEIAICCPSCQKFLAALGPEDNGVRVACHGLSIRVECSDRGEGADTIVTHLPPRFMPEFWGAPEHMERVDS